MLFRMRLQDVGMQGLGRLKPLSRESGFANSSLFCCWRLGRTA
jgi:hypothetical protein